MDAATKKAIRLATKIYRIVSSAEPTLHARITNQAPDLKLLASSLVGHLSRIDIAVKARGSRVGLRMSDASVTAGYLLQQVNNIRMKLEDRDSIISCMETFADNTSYRGIYNQVKHLMEVFDEVEMKNGELSVLTENIELSDRYGNSESLGPMWIRIAIETPLNHISGHLDIKPEDPTYNTVGGERGTHFHPHVDQDGDLCMGERGGPAMAAAWQVFDLLSVFTMANTVLNTYNSTSPYIALENWNDDGMTCDECGSRVSEDDYSTCEISGNILCDDCGTYLEFEDITVAPRYAVYSRPHGCSIRREGAVTDVNGNYVDPEHDDVFLITAGDHEGNYIYDPHRTETFICDKCNETFLEQEYRGDGMCNACYEEQEEDEEESEDEDTHTTEESQTQEAQHAH